MIPAAELERFVNTVGEYQVRNIGRRAHRKTLDKEIAAKSTRSKNTTRLVA